MSVKKLNNIRKVISCIMITALLCVCLAGCSGSSKKKVIQADSNAYSMEFSAPSVSGRKIGSKKFFGQADLTVVYFWKTSSVPSVSELAQYQQWSYEMPDNMQLLGVVTDYNSQFDAVNKETVESILNQYGVTFDNVEPSGGLDKIVTRINIVPTTVFVNSEGKIVGTQVEGADISQCKSIATSLINSAS